MQNKKIGKINIFVLISVLIVSFILFGILFSSCQTEPGRTAEPGSASDSETGILSGSDDYYTHNTDNTSEIVNGTFEFGTTGPEESSFSEPYITTDTWGNTQTSFDSIFSNNAGNTGNIINNPTANSNKTTAPGSVPETKKPVPPPYNPQTTAKPTASPSGNLPPPTTKLYLPVTGNKQDTSTGSGVATIDYSHISQGYVMLKHTGSSKKILGYITAPDGATKYQYPMQSNDQFIACPLQAGNGTYRVQIMENTTGNSYSSLISKDYNVQLDDPNLPFLYASCKVNFNASSKSVAQGAELTRGMSTDLKKIEAICNYISSNIKYDWDKAKAVQTTGYIPDPDVTLSTKKGICGDYSALFAAMLRSQGIPAKLVEGDVDIGRHAWNLVYTKEKGYICVVISFNGTWRIVDTTFRAGGAKGDGTDYKYTPDKEY